MELSSRQNDVLARLLLEGFDARVRLAQQLEATDKLWHINRLDWLQSDSHNCRRLHYRVKKIFLKK
jgi:hypothetical protein